jgi:Domain of unknown function (DUF4337)
MTHGPEQHIEHAEHAAHASHDEFNKRVTMSIAIVAAVLACVTMLGHRAHNETLLLQGAALQIQGDALRIQSDALRVQSEAIQFQTLASMKRTDAANKWAYYQSKNLFHLESKITLDLLKVLSLNENASEDLAKIRKRHQENVDKYDRKLPEIESEARGIEEEAAKFMKTSQEKIKESQDKMAESQKKMIESEAKNEESHQVHQKASRFDYGELGLQFGVVLCSLAILTKSRAFWFFGVAASIIGLIVALTGQFGLFLGGHH